MLAQDGGALGELAPQRGEGVVLALVEGGLELPGAHVLVAPLRADRDAPRRQDARVQPRADERLGLAVRPRGVDVANPGGERRIEDLVRLDPHRVHRAPTGEVLPVLERDVRGAAERGHAEPETGDLGGIGRPGLERLWSHGRGHTTRRRAVPRRAPAGGATR